MPIDRLTGEGWERVRVTAGEAEGGLDLGWRQPEPVVRRPPALKELLQGRPAVVLATEQTERLEAFLGEAEVQAAPGEVELDLDAEIGAGLQVAAADLPVGAENGELGLALLGDHELFGRVRRPVVRRGGPGER